MDGAPASYAQSAYSGGPPAAAPHPATVGLFARFAQHGEAQSIKLKNKIVLSSKVYAVDEHTGQNVFQWRSLSHEYTSSFRRGEWIVEDAQTGEGLLKVQQRHRSLIGVEGNWLILDPRTDQVLCELTRPIVKLLHRRDMQVTFSNLAAATATGYAPSQETWTLHRQYLTRKWQFTAPNGQVVGTVQEPLITHRAVIESTCAACPSSIFRIAYFKHALTCSPFQFLPTWTLSS